MKKGWTKLLTFFIMIMMPLAFFLYFDGQGLPEQPKLKRYFPITEEFDSPHNVKVKDALWHVIPPFEFTAHTNAIVTEKTFEDKIYVTDFFFTRCPGICPTLTKNLTKVQAEFLEDDEVMLLSHTVDPKYDTPKVLARYAQKYKADSTKWLFVTGTEEKLFDIAKKGYFVSVGPGIEESVENYDHTGKFILLDKDRVVRGFYEGTDSSAVFNLIRDIYILKLEYKERDDVQYDPTRKKHEEVGS